MRRMAMRVGTAGVMMALPAMPTLYSAAMGNGARPATYSCPHRGRLQSEIAGHTNAFSRRVQMVNARLDNGGFELDEHSQEKLASLCQQVEAGEINPGQAHFYEGMHWLTSAGRNVASGNWNAYGPCVAGAMANLSAAGVESAGAGGLINMVMKDHWGR